VLRTPNTLAFFTKKRKREISQKVKQLVNFSSLLKISMAKIMLLFEHFSA